MILFLEGERIVLGQEGRGGRTLIYRAGYTPRQLFLKRLPKAISSFSSHSQQMVSSQIGKLRARKILRCPNFLGGTPPHPLGC